MCTFTSTNTDTQSRNKVGATLNNKTMGSILNSGTTVVVKNLSEDKNFQDNMFQRVADSFEGAQGIIDRYDEDSDSYVVEFDKKNEIGNNWLFVEKANVESI